MTVFDDNCDKAKVLMMKHSSHQCPNPQCSKCEEGNKRLVETQDELEQRIAEMEDLYAQRDECLDR